MRCGCTNPIAGIDSKCMQDHCGDVEKRNWIGLVCNLPECGSTQSVRDFCFLGEVVAIYCTADVIPSSACLSRYSWSINATTKNDFTLENLRGKCE